MHSHSGSCIQSEHIFPWSLHCRCWGVPGTHPSCPIFSTSALGSEPTKSEQLEMKTSPLLLRKARPLPAHGRLSLGTESQGHRLVMLCVDWISAPPCTPSCTWQGRGSEWSPYHCVLSNLHTVPVVLSDLRACMLSGFSRVWLFMTPRTVAHQAPLSMGFSKQRYWNGLPFPSPGDLPHPGIEPGSSALKANSLPSVPPGKPCLICTLSQTCERNLSYLGKRHPRGMKGIQRKGQLCPSQQLAVILCYAVKTVHANWFISDRCLIDWSLNRHTLLYCTSQILPFFFFFFNRLKVCGNPASSKSFDSIFPIVFGHFLFLDHISAIVTIFQSFWKILGYS